MNTVRKIFIGASVAAIAAGFAAAAAAQPASATATTSATIIRPLAISKTADLQFGTIVRPASAGTVSLSTGGVISGVIQLNSSTRSAAVFNVTGEGGQTFNISETATLGGPETLTLTLVKAASGGTISQTTAGGTGTLSGALGDTADGALTLTYGASFPITPTTATGAYTGSLVVTVNYN